MSFEKPWGNYLLEKIVETTAPHSISFWPQTIAWQIIFVVVILLAIKKSYQLWRTYKDNSYRREALAWLKACSLNNEDDIRQLPTLLRKTALLANALSQHNEVGVSDNTQKNASEIRHHEITQLSGKSWAAWLDKQCANCQFSQESIEFSYASLLKDLAYISQDTLLLNLNNSEFNKALLQLSQQIGLWIKYHQLSVQPEPKNEVAQNSKTVEANKGLPS